MGGGLGLEATEANGRRGHNKVDEVLQEAKSKQANEGRRGRRDMSENNTTM